MTIDTHTLAPTICQDVLTIQAYSPHKQKRLIQCCSFRDINRHWTLVAKYTQVHKLDAIKGSSMFSPEEIILLRCFYAHT